MASSYYIVYRLAKDNKLQIFFIETTSEEIARETIKRLHNFNADYYCMLTQRIQSIYTMQHFLTSKI